MNYKNIITKATSCLLLAACLLSIFASATSAAAVDIQGAFSDNEGAVAREYMDKYGWDEDQFRVRTWSADIDGETIEFEREAGYQTKFLEDNILTTQKYLGLSGNGSGALDSSGAADLVKIALEEVSAEDNAENPEDSNNVKYNTWFFGKDVTGDQYSWSATFVSWCADKCGLISTKLFKKTNSCADLYKYMINDNGFMSYETKNSTTFGGPEYTPVPGDLMFMYDGNDISTCNRVGIIVSVTSNTIYVVEGDSNGKVEKKGFNKNTEDSDVLNGRIVHVEYPLTFADGGSTEANAPIIFNFLTTYMNFSAAAACGAMGNMMAESHLIPDTTEYGYTWETGAGYGLVQWTNTNKNGRIRGSDSANTVPSGSTTFTWISGHNRTNLVNWCTVNGYDYKSLSGQLYFLKYWLTGKENNTYFSRYLSKLSQQPNTAAGARQCSDIWLQYIEGLPRSNRHLYGDNVFEKHGINRDGTGDREKTRYLRGKQGIFTRDRALIRPGFIRQLETRASTRSASFFHALGSPGRPHNGGGAAGAYRTSNGAKPLKQGHLRAKRGPLGPSRKSQQQTKRTGFAAHGHSIAETAPEGKRASRANGALNRAKINGRGQKQGFGGSDRRAGSVTSCYSRRYDGGGDRAQARQNDPFAKGHFRQSRGDVSLCPYSVGFRGFRAVLSPPKQRDTK